MEFLLLLSSWLLKLPNTTDRRSFEAWMIFSLHTLHLDDLDVDFG